MASADPRATQSAALGEERRAVDNGALDLKRRTKLILELLTLHVGVEVPRNDSENLDEQGQEQEQEQEQAESNDDGVNVAAKSSGVDEANQINAARGRPSSSSDGSRHGTLEDAFPNERIHPESGLHSQESSRKKTTHTSGDIVDPEMPVPLFTAKERLHSARLVFSLSAIDSLSWIVGKAMQFESLQLAKSLDVSYVKIALLLTTVEVAVEFVASALAPYFYRVVQNSTTFTSQNLTAAALKAYGLSCFVATIVYPIMGILIYVVFEPSIGMLATLIVVQSFQYSLLNQVGDALREMAQPHWLHTVQGLDLVIPGRNWARGVLRRPATADSLAVYLQMSFLVISFIFGAVYTVAEDIAIVRWILVLIVAYFNLFVFLSLYRDLPMLQKYIVDKMTDDGKPLVIWLWEMASPERALVLLMLVVTAIPEQAFNALLAVLVLDLEGFLSTVVVGIAALAVFGFLIVRVRRLHKHPRRVPSFDDGAASLEEATFDDGPGLSEHVITQASIVRQQTASVAKNPKSCLRDVFSHWLLAVGGILASLSGGAIGLYLISGTLGIIISMAAFVLVRPFIVQFQTLADRFLFLYDGVRASNIRFWINVATVVVNGPLLALNWWAVSGGLDFVGVDVVEVDEEGETSPEEQRQAAVTLFLSIVAIGVTMVYFVLIDPIMPKSLRKMVRMTPAHAE